MCALYIVSDRLYVLGGEAGSYWERGAYQDQEDNIDDDDVDDDVDNDEDDDDYDDDNDDDDPQLCFYGGYTV